MADPIGITMGDPAGIGPEIRGAIVRRNPPARAVAIGDAGVLRRALGIVGAQLALREVATPAEAQLRARHHRRACRRRARRADPRSAASMRRAGAASFACVERGIAEALSGRLAALVTAPISKAAWAAAGRQFPGHTEILAARAGVTDFAMMLANDELRVLLVSHPSARSPRRCGW